MSTTVSGWVTCQVCGHPASFYEVHRSMLVNGVLDCPSCGLYVSWDEEELSVEVQEPDPARAAHLAGLSAQKPPEEDDDLGEFFWGEVLCQLNKSFV